MTRSRHFERTWQGSATRLALMLSALGLLSLPALAQSSDEDELAMSYGDKSFVSIATGSRVPVTRAPAVATVITTEDIAAIGATDLDDILETVPGLHVSRETQLYAPVYVVRGINIGFNPQVLLLINGVPQTTVYTGNRGGGWGGMPVENIARVEVIRGPGSALYGAEAFSGVINIITKTAGDIDGTEVGLRGGSFNTKDGWMLHGGKWGGVDVAAYLRVGSTDGARSTIRADAQSALDAALGTQASLAPGPVNNDRDFVDGMLDLSLDKWRLHFGYRERKLGSGTGIASALDPTGQSYSQNMGADLNYDDKAILPDTAVSLQASLMHYKEFSDAVLFPAGTKLSPASATFADGMIGNPDKWEQHGRLGASATYTGFSDHRIRAGLGWEKEEVYRTNEVKNFNPDYTPIGTGSVADVIDVTNTAPFMTPHGRYKRYAYAQDEWSLAADWTLTAGIRHDRYSDFGSTTNPRLALVWDAAYNVTGKLMYGTAFRAPSMSELYAINNPVVRGNPDLKPERIRTVEAALTWQPMNRLQLGMNVFHYEMSDIIRLVYGGVQGVYQNTGHQNGHGMELEAEWEFSRALRLSGNYAYQRSTDEATDQDAGNAPHHHVYARADWRFMPNWALHSQVNWISKRMRVAGDPRPDLAGYETVDLTLRNDRGAGHWNFAVSVRNLFDRDVREPSPYENGQVSLPDDFPMPGRAVYAQATYKF
ncbi:MAG TPA: TonB-dependent receptor [Candidatus Aquabacterium excrementipullorum]|nr:TonB-dependent receptor [Candidatus Aquabacterium excrementipullorum]